MIIGLAGKKQVGKSTAAAALADLGFVRVAFADTLKSMAATLLRDCGLSAIELDEAVLNKERVIPTLGVSYRHLCQTLGTEWGRELIHPDLWVIAARARIDSERDFVFEDIRFENEAAMVRRAGGLVLHVRRDTAAADDHASERGVSMLPGDVVVRNDATIDKFVDRLYAIVDAGFGVSK